ncbi:PAS domain-containing protein [Hydrogenimonas thermophila]|uniref:PAS domain S-box-containing protein n=1 Tax=Hydrogenimonas thermophila TaxID=223786 RepID=A0A1I5MPY9_9BACT|nr:PAS domain-containing protein [Hydrogenimonas thermophila]WOE70962.1 PAS domain-containing protein [Hydrogenimonas thermophila]WOE73480.1 PAS domain-containing protein [Hydrogenimonas thermophila]SFP10981.1 PAS domain S-box-containing protein [Hydrogenimonas thermophila]
MRRPTPINNEKVLNEDDFIVSKTDLKGRIIYGNKIFIKISGYEENELLGAPHSILRHPDMPKIVFKLLWERIQNKQEIFAYVKNLCKDGSFYWVFANVTVTTDPQGNPRDYHSVRRKPSARALDVIKPLYAQLIEEERRGGMEASGRLLNKILEEKGVSYDELILGLQQ